MITNLIKENSKLKFVDATEGKEYSLNEILYQLDSLQKEKRNLIFLYLNNDIKEVGLYFSVVNTDNTIALLNKDLPLELKSNLEEKYQPKYIFDNSRDKIDYFNIINVNSSSFESKLFINTKSSSIKLDSNIKLLLSTSGTTGSPKFVKLSDSNLVENAKSIIDYLPINNQDVVPLNLPIYYSYGLSVLHTNAISGGTIVCGVSDILQRDFWKEFEKFKFTSISGVPYVYEMLNRIGFRKKQYASLKYCSQAGGNLNEKTKQLFLDYFSDNDISFYVMYGQTEATARISFVPPLDLANNITSIGKPILNGSLSINEETNELQYSGPNIFGGYAETPTDLEVWENLKILHTGDVAVEKDGFYYITGRLKRFVKIFGSRINLDDIETILKNKYENTSFATIGNNDKELLIAHIGDDIISKDVKDFLHTALKIHPSVVKFFKLETFPLTNNGKVDYKKILNFYESI